MCTLDTWCFIAVYTTFGIHNMQPTTSMEAFAQESECRKMEAYFTAHLNEPMMLVEGHKAVTYIIHEVECMHPGRIH